MVERLTPCHTIRRLHGVAPALSIFSERRGIAGKCRKSLQIILHFHKMEISRRPFGDYGVSTESPRSAIAFPRSSSWRSTARSRRVHGAFTARSRRAHGALTARSRRAHGALTARSRRAHGALKARSRRAHGVLGAATARARRPKHAHGVL